MECTIRWLGEETMSFVAETGSGHSFVMDTALQSGGRNLGPRPMESLLSGAIACTAYDVVSHLKENSQDVWSFKVGVTAERSEENPKVFTKIHIEFIIFGNAIDENIVTKAIELSKTMYGSGYKMLSLTANITESFEILKTIKK